MSENTKLTFNTKLFLKDFAIILLFVVIWSAAVGFLMKAEGMPPQMVSPAVIPAVVVVGFVTKYRIHKKRYEVKNESQ